MCCSQYPRPRQRLGRHMLKDVQISTGRAYLTLTLLNEIFAPGPTFGDELEKAAALEHAPGFKEAGTILSCAAWIFSRH